MAKQYLDKDGLLYFWQKIKTYFTGTATPSMNGTAAVGTSTKLAREDHVHPSDTSKVDKVSGKGLSTNDYTTAEKNKLAGIAAGAEVNQNAFSNVKVGSTTVAADAKTDTLELVAGSNVTITPDATNDKVTIAATNTTYTPASAAPLMDGTAAVGTSAKYAREDHVHPSDTSKVNKETGYGLSDARSVLLYSAIVGDSEPLNNGVKITNQSGTESEVKIPHSRAYAFYGECSTAAATTAKVVSVNNNNVNNGFQLYTGATVYVKFTVTNTGAVANLTLNVNSTGAKAIKYRNANLSAAGVLAANRIYCFVYDGTYWQIVGDLDTNTTYANYSFGQGYGTCSTAAATAAKVVTLANYALSAGGIVTVKFDYSIPANATMNINSKGAKPIFYKGAAITADIIPNDNTTATFMYDGTNYHLIAIAKGYITKGPEVVAYDAGSGLSIWIDGVETRLARVGSTGLIPAWQLPDASTDAKGAMTAAMVTKLNGIAEGANKYTHPAYTARTGKPTANATPGFGGTVTISQITSDATGHVTGATDRTITIPSTAASTTAAGLMSSTDKTKLDKLKFDSSNKIDSSILPSYVDDVIEAYARSGQDALSSTWLATGSASGTVITPETGKIYVLMADSGDYAANTQFRWGGTAYVKLADGGVSSITNAEIDTIVAA